MNSSTGDCVFFGFGFFVISSSVTSNQFQMRQRRGRADYKVTPTHCWTYLFLENSLRRHHYQSKKQTKQNLSREAPNIGSHINTHNYLFFWCFYFFSMVLHGCDMGFLLCLLILRFSKDMPTSGFSCRLPQK